MFDDCIKMMLKSFIFLIFLLKKEKLDSILILCLYLIVKAEKG